MPTTTRCHEEGPQNVKRKANEEVNAAIRKFADGEKVIWCDFNAKYLDAKGAATTAANAATATSAEPRRCR